MAGVSMGGTSGCDADFTQGSNTFSFGVWVHCLWPDGWYTHVEIWKGPIPLFKDSSRPNGIDSCSDVWGYWRSVTVENEIFDTLFRTFLLLGTHFDMSWQPFQGWILLDWFLIDPKKSLLVPKEWKRVKNLYTTQKYILYLQTRPKIIKKNYRNSKSTNENEKNFQKKNMFRASKVKRSQKFVFRVAEFWMKFAGSTQNPKKNYLNGTEIIKNK
jgi:hypothetical protein